MDRHEIQVALVRDKKIREIHELMLRAKVTLDDIKDYVEKRYVPRAKRMEDIRKAKLARKRQLEGLAKARAARAAKKQEV